MTRYLVVFVVALIGALAVTPLARRAALRFDIVDNPGGRKAHAAPMPYLGGLAIYLAFMVFLLGLFVRNRTGADTTPLVQGVAIVVGATLMAALGLVDDRFSLPPLIKLAGQFIAAVLLFVAGVHFHFNHFPMLDAPISVLFVLGITNAFNLLDNMDGLSVGTAAIGCLNFFALALLQPGNKQYIVATMAAALAGACLGFLYYNFNPARIFMGDAGSLFLGFMLAVLGLKINMNGFANLHAVNFFVPIVVLGVPIFDTSLVVVSRLRRGVSPAQGGRDHTSHRLVLLGLTVREAVMTVYIAGFGLGLCGILLTAASGTGGLALVGLLVAVGLGAGYKLEGVYRSLQPAAVGHQPAVSAPLAGASIRAMATRPHATRTAGAATVPRTKKG